MRTANSRMIARFRRISRQAGELAPPLVELLESPLLQISDAVVFQQLLSPHANPPPSEEATAFEASVNKIHVADYLTTDAVEELLLQGVNFAERLVAKLEDMNRPCRVILSLDPDSDEVTVRFFVRRESQPWGADDVETYKAEDVIQWDVG